MTIEATVDASVALDTVYTHSAVAAMRPLRVFSMVRWRRGPRRVGRTDDAADHVDLRLCATVDRIDPRRREVRRSTSQRIIFDRLILATGATPRRLDVPIDSAARLYSLRAWAHADALRGIADAVRKVVIIGSGFIGLEAAASLRDRGLDVNRRRTRCKRPRPTSSRRVMRRSIATAVVSQSRKRCS